MQGGMAGRARRQRLQPRCCSSRGASGGAFVVRAKMRKALQSIVNSKTRKVLA